MFENFRSVAQSLPLHQIDHIKKFIDRRLVTHLALYCKSTWTLIWLIFRIMQWLCTCILLRLLFMRSPMLLGFIASGFNPHQHHLLHMFVWSVGWHNVCLVTGSLGKRHKFSIHGHQCCPGLSSITSGACQTSNFSYLSPLYMDAASCITFASSITTGMVPPGKFTSAWRTCGWENSVFFETISNSMLYLYLDHVLM